MLLELLLYGSFFYDLNSKRRNCMNELLFFTLGLLIGGLTGVSVMCVLQINRVNEMKNKYDDKRKKLD